MSLLYAACWKNRLRSLKCGAAVLVMSVGIAHANPAENDDAMEALARRSGCMACHSILPLAKRSDGLPPIAPAWRDIAIRYRNDPLASARLTRVVMTGSNPQASHWAGKVGAAAMPPNELALSEAEARVLVNWLLVLVP